MNHDTGFRLLAKGRIKTVSLLIKNEDWEMAAYMMGYLLECSLKAAACKSLGLAKFPEGKTEASKFFRTHKFDPLLIVSGHSHAFSADGDAKKWQNWSDFTNAYPGDWINMRYDINLGKKMDETTVKSLYNNLMDPVSGIITYIKKRW